MEQHLCKFQWKGYKVHNNSLEIKERCEVHPTYLKHVSMHPWSLSCPDHIKTKNVSIRIFGDFSKMKFHCMDIKIILVSKFLIKNTVKLNPSKSSMHFKLRGNFLYAKFDIFLLKVMKLSYKNCREFTKHLFIWNDCDLTTWRASSNNFSCSSCGDMCEVL